MKIAIASDHRGVNIKKALVEGLKKMGNETFDCSPDNKEGDDYPDYAFLVGKSIVKKESEVGILICGSGIGMSIAANKIKGIRCARIVTEEDAKSSREHNGANVAALSSDLPPQTMAKIISIFLSTPVAKEERHQRRIGKIIKMETGEYNEL